MGKRKTKRKPVVKKKPRLDTLFSCEFCNHEKAVEAKLDFASLLGHVTCSVCGTTWSTSINKLSQPIDVYSDWVDWAVGSREQEKPKGRGLRAPGRVSAYGSGKGVKAEYDEDADRDDPKGAEGQTGRGRKGTWATREHLDDEFGEYADPYIAKYDNQG